MLDIATVCAYCRIRPAVTRDHVIPKTLVKQGKSGNAWTRQRRVEVGRIDPALLLTVPACFECNIRKGTRKLVPTSWAKKIPLLKEAIPGQWRVWNGDPKAKSYTAVYR